MASLIDDFNGAIAALSRGDLTQARFRGEKLLKAQPGNGSVLQLMGVICSQSGDHARSADFFRKAIARGADARDNSVNLAKALLAGGRGDEALAVCDQPGLRDQAEIRRMRAEVLKALGRFDEAAALYEQLVHESPGDFDSWNNLGNTRHDLGDLEGALLALQEARRLNDTSALVLLNIGRVLASMDRHQEACLALEKAALLDPKDPLPLLELGRSLTSIDHPTDGLRALGAAARLTPDDPRIFVAMALAFSDLSDPKKGEQALRFALKADPGHLPAILNLGVLLEKANRLDELEELIGQARARHPSSDELRYLDALLLSRQGKVEEALERLKHIQSRAIHPAMLAQFRGQLADRLGRVDEAFAAFDEMNREMALSPLGTAVDRSAYQRGIERLQSEKIGRAHV
jgi:tetratricopeptide (TPR) repeat protein